MENNFHTQQFLKLQPICLGKFHYFAELNSTNDYAKKLVADGAESGTLILAEHQTLGRGRGGNAWLSPAGEGLLFTLVIDPDVDQIIWNRFSLIAGVAVARAITALCPKPINLLLKWPNDVYLNEKKCAGILAEIVDNKLLIGIGLNVSVTDFPAEISAKATSLLCEGIEVEREPLLAAIVTEIFKIGSMAGEHFEHIITSYNELCMLTGKQIMFTSAGKRLEGRVVKIGTDGNLVVDHEGELVAYNEAKDIWLA